MSKPLRMLMLALATLMLPGLAAADPQPALGLLLSPVFAGAAMALSSVSVVNNGFGVLTTDHSGASHGSLVDQLGRQRAAFPLYRQISVSLKISVSLLTAL